jgi:hypothetical protein
MFSFSQDSLDSLKKYSYPIYAQGRSICVNGTGFFYKKKDNRYLITNYHVLTNLNTITGKCEGETPSSVEILYKTKQGKESSFVVPLPPELKNIEPFVWYQKIDIAAIRIEYP